MKHSGFHQQVVLTVGSLSSHGQVDQKCSKFAVEELSRLAVGEVEVAKELVEAEGCTAALQEECR